MSEKLIYALNTVSGIVAQVTQATLDHPTFGKHYVEVEDPDTCITCGIQPDEVTLVDDAAPEPTPEATDKPAKPTRRNMTRNTNKE